MDAEKFGAFILERRKELNMTQAQLAEKLHITSKAISRWERGVGFPDINLLDPLARALDITLLELMQSERTKQESIPSENVQSVVSDALEIALEQERARVKEEKALQKKIDASTSFVTFLAMQNIFRVVYDEDTSWLILAIFTAIELVLGKVWVSRLRNELKPKTKMDAFFKFLGYVCLAGGIVVLFLALSILGKVQTQNFELSFTNDNTIVFLLAVIIGTCLMLLSDRLISKQKK